MAVSTGITAKGFRWFLVVIGVGVAWLGLLKLRAKHTCLFSQARTYRLHFAWNDRLERLHIEDLQNGNTSARLQEVLRKEAVERLKKIASETGLRAAEGQISLSIAGCAEPYITYWF